MDIDAEALGDLLGTIRALSRRHPDRPAFLPALDRNIDLLPVPRWQEVLFRERLVYVWGDGEDDSKAKSLAKTLDLDGTEDTELLAFVLPLRDDLSVSERLALADRIVTNSKDWEERVRFLCYRAMVWGLHGDDKESARGFLKAVKAVPSKPDPSWAHSLVVEAYISAGLSNARNDLIEHALKLCNAFLEAAANNPVREAELRKARSDAMKRLGREADCVEDLRWVVDHRGTDDDLIQLAQALIAVGEYEEARGILESVVFDELTPGERYDHTFGMFGLLYGIQEQDLIELVRRRLSDLDPEFPAWREVRDKFLLALARSTEAGGYPTWWESIRESLILQPNVFGIGIDVGRILDRALRRRSRGAQAHRLLTDTSAGEE